ncbi:hypothetical protein ES708_20501 [subsurface metagenome]
MKVLYCKVCEGLVLCYMNFPADFEKKEVSKRVAVCRECWSEVE